MRRSWVQRALVLIAMASPVASLAVVTKRAPAADTIRVHSAPWHASDAGPAPKISPHPPDPPPLSESASWVIDLRFVRGEVYWVDLWRYPHRLPRPTPRVIGRFALELYEGAALVERVRFDFPMLTAPAVDSKARLAWEDTVTTRIGVLFPITSRGTHMELRDRATGARWELPWPLDAHHRADGRFIPPRIE